MGPLFVVYHARRVPQTVTKVSLAPSGASRTFRINTGGRATSATVRAAHIIHTVPILSAPGPTFRSPTTVVSYKNTTPVNKGTVEDALSYIAHHPSCKPAQAARDVGACKMALSRAIKGLEK